jgi:hypothetical protein
VVEHIVEELKKKPFWHLCRHKTYTNMYVSRVNDAP